MLMYGNGIEFIPPIEKTIIYNFASLKEQFERLPNLIPPNNIGRLVDYNFDIAYADYIMNYEPAFLEMFNIVLHLYSGNDVYLMITYQDWTENIVESLFKFIQQRYGYNGVRIGDYEDYIFFNNQTFQFDYNYGVANFKSDRERFTIEAEKIRLNNGGKVHEFE